MTDLQLLRRLTSVRLTHVLPVEHGYPWWATEADDCDTLCHVKPIHAQNKLPSEVSGPP